MLSEVLTHDRDATVCLAEVSRMPLFHEPDGSIGGWVGLEIMAQCVAVHAGMKARRDGDCPRIGLLLGTRRLRLHRTRFHSQQELRVVATHTWGKDVGLVSFECEIEDANSGERLAEGRLNCIMPKDDAALEAIL